MARQRHILFILADDMGPWAMGCAGNADVRTPTLDKLAAEGVRFANFFCASPVCSPARGTILTGRMPSAHGVHDWLKAGNSTAEPGGTRIEYLADQRGYTETLAAAGYVCGLSGKWHLGDAHVAQKGMSFWRVYAKGGGAYYGAPMIRDGQVYEEPRYVTDVITDNALAFLDERAGGDEPWYLGVHYTAPHSPWEREHHPRDLWNGYVQNGTFDATPSEPLHPWQVAGLFPQDEGQRRKHLGGYYAAITAMDAGIGRLLEKLDHLGLREDTLIVFTSDNGMNMGHHGLWGKGNASYPANMYEQSVKVPTIINQPGAVAGGRVHEGLLSHYDLFPTLLEWAQTEAPADELRPGVSFASVLAGDDTPVRDRVVIFDEYGPTRMIRTQRHKYVHRTGDLACELYDMAADPDEQVNLLGDGTKPIDGQARALQKRMLEELNGWFAAHATARCDGAQLPVTGSGQLDVCWATDPAQVFEPAPGYVDRRMQVPRRQRGLDGA